MPADQLASCPRPSPRQHPLTWLLGLVWLTLAGLLQAEERSVHVRWIDAAAGLQQSSILGLHQDRRGFVWIATQGGLHRYDGHRMLLFRQRPDEPEGLPENFVTAMADAEDGSLYVGTRSSGLFRIGVDQRIQPIALHDDDVDHRSIRALHQDRHHLWVASAAGVHRLDARGTETAWHWPEPGVGIRRILSTAESAWLATDRGLYRAEADSLRQVDIGFPINDLADADGGQLWLAAADGLHLYQPDSGHSRRIWPKQADQYCAWCVVIRISFGWHSDGRDCCS